VRALVAALVLERDGPVSAPRLVDALWGDRPPRTASHAVQVHVSALRRAFRTAGVECPIITGPSGYELARSGAVVDAEQFELEVADARAAIVAGESHRAVGLLDTARSRWRGEPYADLPDDPVAGIERGRLLSMLLDAEDEWAAASLACGRDHDLVPALEAALAAEPLRERRAHQLMLALYRAGRAPEALDTYQRFRAMLAEDLGLEPGPLLRDTEQAILMHDTALLGVRVGPPIDRDRFGPGRFVGRTEEWSRLGAVVASTATGHGRLVLVGGPPGIGKTRLVSEVSTAVGPLQVAHGATPDGASAPPLWPIVEALRELGPSALPPTGPGLDNEVLEPLRDMVAGRVSATSAATSVLGDGDDAFRVHEAVADLLIAVARRTPLLLVLDDIHGADAVTMGVLSRLAPRIGHESLGVLATHRDTPGDHGDAFASTIATLVRSSAVERITLGPLGRDDVGRYLEATGLGDPELIDAVHQRCDGSPLFLVELAGLLLERQGDRGAVAELPDGLAAVLDARLVQLGPGRRVIEEAAVLGPRFSVTTLARMSTAGTDELIRALDDAAALGLLDVVDRDHRRFHHALIVDAAMRALSADALAATHLRAADAIERSSGLEPSIALTESARHRVAALPAGDPTLAAATCVAAAQLAARSSSDADTITLATAARRALDLAQQPDPRLRATALILEGEARTMGGHDARSLLEAALEDARLTGDPELVASAVRAIVLHRSTASAAGSTSTVSLLDEALSGLTDTGGWLAVQLATDLAMALLRTEQWPRSVEIAEHALTEARRSDDPRSRAFALTGLHQTLTDARSAERRLALAAEAVVAAQAAGFAWHESMAHSFVANDRWELGDLDGAAAALEHCERRARDSRRARFLWIARSWQGLHALYSGDREQAETLFATALEPWGERPNPDAGLCELSQRMNLALLDGQVDSFVGVARFQLDADAEPLFWHTVLALMCSMQGDTDEARRSLDHLVDVGPDRLFPTVTRLPGLLFAAEAAARIDHVAAARAVLPVLEPYAGRHAVMNVFGGGGLCWGVADQGLAFASATVGDHQAAARWQASACAHLEAAGATTFVERAGRVGAALLSR
jgi:DNA-binding SARP family transcriptional activator/tetratricopeptide (TPR) repeat protein